MRATYIVQPRYGIKLGVEERCLTKLHYPFVINVFYSPYLDMSPYRRWIFNVIHGSTIGVGAYLLACKKYQHGDGWGYDSTA